MTDSEATHKFVAVLNKKVPVNILMNSLGHMAAGLTALYPEINEMRFHDYEDKDGNKLPSISDNPFIVLRADNSNKIRTLKEAFSRGGINFTLFSDTMTQGTFSYQHELTKNTKEEDLEYYGICAFGKIKDLDKYTKKFSLWK